MTLADRNRHARAVENTVAQTDALFAGASARIADGIEALGDRPLTELDHARVMQIVDRELALIYGSSKGARNRLEGVITRGTEAVRRSAATAQIAPIRAALKRIDPATLYAIERRMTGK